MDNFKLDLTQLTPVAEADRIRGNWYVVADNLNQYGGISQWHSGRNRISPNDGDEGIKYDFWFAIPPGLPGFPKSDLPDEFELVQNKHEYYSHYHEKWMHISALTGENEILFRRKPKPTLPELTIPSGTLEEQIEATKKILAELETKACGSR